MGFIRSKLTFANVVALLALFVALGGSAYAIHLGKNAVKTRNIKNGAVTEAKLAPGAVSASKLAPGAVKSPSVVVRLDSKSLNDGSNALPTAVCQPGEVAVGGGGYTAAAGSDIQFVGLRPVQADESAATTGDTPGAYYAEFANSIGGTGSTTAFALALCMK